MRYTIWIEGMKFVTLSRQQTDERAALTFLDQADQSTPRGIACRR
jgi:hypothetical protein